MKFCPKCGEGLETRQVVAGDRERLVCPACSFIFYLDPKVAACTIPVQDGKIILTRRAIEPARGKWVFPGGYVERGETVEEAALRETKEETNLDVRLLEILNVYSYSTSIVVVIVFRAEVLGGEPVPGHECLDVSAFYPAEIPWDELAFRSTHDALRDWLAKVGTGAQGGHW